MTDYILRNDKAKIMTIAPKDLVLRFLKWECPDGAYSVEGPDTNCTLYRKNGIVYPSSGNVGDTHFKTRNLDECIDLFGNSPECGKLASSQVLGLKGEVVLRHDGKVGIYVPPGRQMNYPGLEEPPKKAIEFEVIRLHPDTEHMASWGDIRLEGGKHVRINPEIIQPPYWRLADCLLFAHERWDDLAQGSGFNKLTFPPLPHPNSQDFAFQRYVLPGDGTEIVLIDTWERLERYAKSKDIRDGQHRTRSPRK